jgi:hypothetical protein
VSYLDRVPVVLPLTEEALSAQNTPKRSPELRELTRVPTSSSMMTGADYMTSASTSTKVTAMPRRVMLNGTLYWDHRFDPAGSAIKDGLSLSYLSLVSLLCLSLRSMLARYPLLLSLGETFACCDWRLCCGAPALLA